MKTLKQDNLKSLLILLEEQLRLLKSRRLELVVCGGSALIALNLVQRATRDIDVVAMISEKKLSDPEPFPEELRQAVKKIAANSDLPGDWLNAAPADLFRMGLPEGFKERLTVWEIGPTLAVHFIGRLDQIHFKLYAAVDRGGYHITDLMALNPDNNEIWQAARWVLTHDVSIGFLSLLKDLLTELGYVEVICKI
ncbi:MAG: nucleotidyl transferase AbiEii/AbiGii toxin family protein [Candidatus Riflebacteria bacterium]|nr:nucleotidyl transferase AbiEii/AbiGii toxin family protein [Candidatus Riflebacteria bacterium]